MSGERCHDCDRLAATAEQLAAQARNGAADGETVCYGANALHLCGPAHRVDWRARALAAERDRDTASGLLGATLVCLTAERAYHATEGRPWAERIAARKVADEARATLARMMGGE